MATRTAGSLASAQAPQADNGAEKHDMSPIVNRLRATFNSGKTRPLTWRRGQLKALKAMVIENMDAWVDALCKDLGRHKSMSVFGDVNSCLHSIDVCLDKLEEWNARRAVGIQVELFGSTGFQQPTPKGVVLNIAPWNFPMELLLSPCAYMVAAGNCVVMKPSEVSQNVAKLVVELVPKYLDSDAWAVVDGGVPETTAILAQKFDHILYTGNNYVATIVMTAAAKHLTPVTLELGGKSPVVVDKTCDIAKAVQRILNIKTINSGQICVSPDYVLLHKDQEKAFYEQVAITMKKWYPQGQENDTGYSKIINHNHFNRVKSLLDNHGGEVVWGGLDKCDEKTKMFVTTIVKNPSQDSRLMKEEIFGPLLPVVTVNSLDEAVGIIRQNDHPLALYIFSDNQTSIDKVLEETQSGGVCINDCLVHLIADNLPFGGVGPSGMGVTHGKAGFDQFVHLRSVLHRGGIDLLAQARYPPHNDAKYKQLVMAATKSYGIKKTIGQVLKVGGPVLLAVLLWVMYGKFAK